MPIQDDILPLTKPIVGASGRVYKEVPVPKGTAINVSIAAYNMCVLFFLANHNPPRCRALIVFLVAETRICGVQTLISSDRSVGSRCLTRRNRPLGYMGTCAVPNAVAGTLNTEPPRSHSGTFSGGVRSCIGWRFACVDHLVRSPEGAEDHPFDSLVEVQAFLVTLVRRFDISLTDKQPQLGRIASGVMVPFIPGEEDKGLQLPLKIAAIGSE